MVQGFRQTEAEVAAEVDSDEREQMIDRLQRELLVIRRRRLAMTDAIRTIESSLEDMGAIDISKAKVEAVERFEDEARNNAANVTANRARDFIVFHEDKISHLLSGFCFMKGLTEFDRAAIWAHILGNPRPIVVEPERGPEHEIENILDL